MLSLPLVLVLRSNTRGFSFKKTVSELFFQTHVHCYHVYYNVTLCLDYDVTI